MKRSPLARRTPLRSGGSLLRRAVARVRRPRDSGPTQTTRELVHARSGGWCEWPGCRAAATDVHHRLGRKAGSRFGEARERINRPSNLIAACRACHEFVTDAWGERLARARDVGWIVRENEDPRWVPIRTERGYRYLNDEGGYDE